MIENSNKIFPTAEQVAQIERSTLPGLLVGTSWRTELAGAQLTDEQTSSVYEIYNALIGYSAPKRTPENRIWTDKPIILDILLRVAELRTLIAQSLDSALNNTGSAVDIDLDLQRVASAVTLDARAQRMADSYFTARNSDEAHTAAQRYEQATHDLLVAVAAIYNPAKEHLSYEPSGTTHVLSTVRLRRLPKASRGDSDDEGLEPELPAPVVGGGLVRRSLSLLVGALLTQMLEFSNIVFTSLLYCAQLWLDRGVPLAENFYLTREAQMRVEQFKNNRLITCGYVNLQRLPLSTAYLGDYGLGYYAVQPPAVEICTLSTVPIIQPAEVTRLYQSLASYVQSQVSVLLFLSVPGLSSAGFVATAIVMLMSTAITTFLIRSALSTMRRLSAAASIGLLQGAGASFRAVGNVDRDL